MGRIETMKALLLEKADIESVNKKGWTPLLAAVNQEKSMAVLTLLQNNANIKHQDNEGNTALHLAAERGDSPTIKVLLPRAETEIVNNKRWTPLLVAAQAGKSAAVSQLLQAGANINYQDPLGNTALHLAAGSGDIKTIQQLLPKADKEATNNAEQTPLFMAVYGRRLDAVQLLLDQGANVNAQDAFGQTCLITSVIYPVITELLLKEGAKVDHQDKTGNTALHHTVMLNKKETAEVLLTWKADTMIRNNDNVSPLVLATRYNRFDLSEFIRTFE